MWKQRTTAHFALEYKKSRNQPGKVVSDMTNSRLHQQARPTQTKVKHLILERYLHTWGGIIINGLRQKARKIGHTFQLHFVYVDCNAASGRYKCEQEDDQRDNPPGPVFGSPIIGITALDELATYAKNEGIKVRRNVILIEKDQTALSELQETLKMKHLDTRVQETQDVDPLEDGQIALVCGDSTTMSDQLNRYTQPPYTFSLFFLDPFGPMGLPLNFVGTIIRQPRHDVIINMPYQDVHKKTGSSRQELVRHHNAMFGHDHWPTITPGDLSRELSLVDCYRQSLESVDSDLTVKTIGLRFPDKERTMFYLYLTTHDPNGAVSMNKILWDANWQEYELRWRLREAKKETICQMRNMFEDQPPEPERPERATKEEIGEHICNLVHGRSLSRRDIYKALANESYFSTEIDQALRYLKKQQLVSFEGSLHHQTIVQGKGKYQ
jgi:three-Cys-motif partner protein